MLCMQEAVTHGGFPHLYVVWRRIRSSPKVAQVASANDGAFQWPMREERIRLHHMRTRRVTMVALSFSS